MNADYEEIQKLGYGLVYRPLTRPFTQEEEIKYKLAQKLCENIKVNDLKEDNEISS